MVRTRGENHKGRRKKGEDGEGRKKEKRGRRRGEGKKREKEGRGRGKRDKGGGQSGRPLVRHKKTACEGVIGVPVALRDAGCDSDSWDFSPSRFLTVAQRTGRTGRTGE